MRFLVCCYGEHYASFLAVCLRSLRLSHPIAHVCVIHDFEAKLAEPLQARNPKVEFRCLAQDTAILTHPDERIAAKLDYWSWFLDEANDGEVVVFLDADTLVRADISEFLECDFDILITRKDEHPPINTGVVAVRVSDRTKALLRRWRDDTSSIVEDATARGRAIKIGGGFDQYTLLQLMGIPEGEAPPHGVFRVNTPVGQITFHGAKCDVLNQTNSVPLSHNAKILHYKGAWRWILLNGKRFTKRRTYEQSAEMYWLWLDCLRGEERTMGIRTLSWRARTRHFLRRLAATPGARTGVWTRAVIRRRTSDEGLSK